ncbi:MAG: rRNA maturation RNase YbeY [Candidatus Woykebacteria bacterium]
MTYKVAAYVEPHYPIKKSLLVHSAEAALTAANVKGKIEVFVSVIGDRKMRGLNKEYRGIDAPTDVLAFPDSLGEGKVKEFVSPPSKYLNLGDVIISYPQLINRAAKEELMVDDMAQLLVIHGVFHLLGYDHEKSEEAASMEALEDKALASVKV